MLTNPMLRPGSLRTRTPIRRGYTDPLASFFSDVDALLGQATSNRTAVPRANAYRTDDAYHLVFEVPGLRSEDLEVEARDGGLRVKGEVKSSLPEGARLLRKERASELTFERVYTFADDADLSNTQAVLKDGLLQLTVPRHQPQTRRIDIKVG